MVGSGKAASPPPPSRRVWVVVAVVVAAACVGAGGARADGDPASDYLLSQQAFVSPNARVSTADTRRLADSLTILRRAGYRIRVAVIQSRFDLGAVTVLDGKPRLYARFLSQELRFVYKGRLLVVMPNGYGFAHDGRSVPNEQSVVDGVRPASSLDGAKLVAATIAAEKALAAAHGIDVTRLPGWPRPTRGPDWDRDIAFTAAAVVLLILFVAVVSRGRPASVWVRSSGPPRRPSRTVPGRSGPAGSRSATRQRRGSTPPCLPRSRRR
jgi:hypothetical protein